MHYILENEGQLMANECFPYLSLAHSIFVLLVFQYLVPICQIFSWLQDLKSQNGVQDKAG